MGDLVNKEEKGEDTVDVMYGDCVVRQARAKHFCKLTVS